MTFKLIISNLIKRIRPTLNKAKKTRGRIWNYLKEDIFLIKKIEETELKSSEEYKFIRQIKKLIQEFPFVAFFVATFLGLIADKVGISEPIKSIVLDWVNWTRDFWRRIFSFLQIEIKISNYELDILTLAFLSLNSILISSLLKKVRILNLNKYRNHSLWQYAKVIDAKKGIKKIIAFAIPFLVSGFIFISLSVLNVIDKFKTKEGRYFIALEIAVVLVILAFNLLMVVIKSIAASDWRKLKSFGTVLFRTILIYCWFASFLPIEFWGYNQSQKLFSVFLIGLSTFIFSIAFFRNWKFFAYSVAYIGAILFFDYFFK